MTTGRWALVAKPSVASSLNVSPCSPAGASSRATSTCDGIATRNGIMLVSHIRHLQERKA